jgi:uncharacterized protein (DUF2345 family)
VNADTAIVGTNSSVVATGLAYIFVRSGTTWSQQAMLQSPGDSGDNGFGSAVAVNGDTVLCGEPGDSQEIGEAYIFVRSGTTWTAQPKLTASDRAIVDVFSSAVALSSDTALFGSPGKTNGMGEAYAFVRSGATFAQQAVLLPAGATGADNFGSALAASGDTVFAGAPGKFSNQGAVYIFTGSGGTWTQQSELTASDATCTM